ncbi:uncharacterized protein [Pocillopora verrucosa]|uniref:uncharacterized protein isoform X2 n=1 Tax=Pocillopora verrucosa TaxID=203993 RepID=UPI00334292EB
MVASFPVNWRMSTKVRSTYPSEIQKRLKDKFMELKGDLEDTRSAIRAKEEKNQLTKEVLLEKMQTILNEITALENDILLFMDKLDNFCDSCPTDRCQFISGRNSNRLERLKKVGGMMKERYDKIEAEEPAKALLTARHYTGGKDYLGALG